MLIEDIRHCSTCVETTPHSRRTLAFPKLFAGALSILALACFLWGGILLALIPLALAILLLACDRERCWGVHCERCRERARAGVRRPKPTLDGRTEILPW